MNSTTNYSFEETVLKLDNMEIKGGDIVDVLRLKWQMPMLVQELVLNNAIKNISVDKEEEIEILNQFKEGQGLTNNDAYKEFLKTNYIDEILLMRHLTRPIKIVRYREERWGPYANSLYLKNKDKYDTIKYKKIESINENVMQEIYFRLKDKEETWESLVKNIQGNQINAVINMGPVPVSQIDSRIVNLLRKSGPNRITKPTRVGEVTIVAELESLETNHFNDELKTLILRDEFENWLQSESNRMLNKLEV